MSGARTGTWALVLVALAVVAPACSNGGTGPGVAQVGSTTALPTGSTGALAFSACMRSHAISNFPDPGGELPAGIDTLSPGYQAAQRSCQTLLPLGNAGGPAAADERAALRYAACLRSHGVPNFPDPIVGHGFQFNLPTGLDPKSPQFLAAQKACSSWLPNRGQGPVQRPAP